MTDDKEVRRELESVAYSEATSGRGLIAKTTALRALERLNRPRDKRKPPCPPDWHPQPGSILAELDEPHFDEHPEARVRLFDALWENGELYEDGHYIDRQADL